VCLAKAYLKKWGDEPTLRDIAQMKREENVQS
jgi:hypothetical protein